MLCLVSLPTDFTAARFPVERSEFVNTGLVVRQQVNQLGSIGQGNIRFTLYDQVGKQLRTLTPSLGGAKFFDEIFDSIPQDFIGSVEVESEGPFYLTVLRQELIPGDTLRFQLTSVPATPVP